MDAKGCPIPAGGRTGLPAYQRNWEEAIEGAKAFGVEPPICAMIEEVMMVNDNWDARWRVLRSVIYLRQKEWGRDELWTELARRLFDVFQGLCLTAVQSADIQVRKYYKANTLPSKEMVPCSG